MEFHYFRMPDPEWRRRRDLGARSTPAAAAQCNPMVWDDDDLGGPAYVDNGELRLSDVGVVGGCTAVVAGTRPASESGRRGGGRGAGPSSSSPERL